MKITASTNTARATLSNGAQRASTAGDTKGAVNANEPVGAADAQDPAVNLSATSALHTSSDADIDTAKVESIKAALCDGTYQIDSGKIADGMLGSARELMQKRTR